MLISTLIFFPVSAQNIPLEELEASYQKCKTISKKKIDLANEIAYAIHWKSPQLADKYIEEALQESKELGYAEGESTSIWLKGITFTQSDRKKALELFEKAYAIAAKAKYYKGICNTLIGIANINIDLRIINKSDSILKSCIPIAKKIDDKSILSKIYSTLARNSEQEGNYSEAIDYLNKVIEMSLITNDKFMISRSYGSISLIYVRQGKFNEALENNIKKRLICEEIGDRKGEIITIVNISGVLYNQKEYDKAIEALMEAYLMAEKIDDREIMSACMLNIGTIENEQKKPTALQSLKKALELSDEVKLDLQISILENISSYYISQKNFDEGMKYLSEAQKIAEELQDQRVLESIWMRYGEYYNQSNQPQKAIPYLNKALSIALDRKLFESIRRNNLLLSDSYYRLGDYKKSLEYFKEYKNNNDSIFNAQNIRQLALTESQYKYEKQKREYELTQAHHELKIKSQRQIIVAIVLLLVLILILLITIYRSAKLKKQVLLLKIENIKREAELREKEMAAAKLKLVQNAERDTQCLKLLENIESDVESGSKGDMRSLINYYKHQSDENSWNEFEALFIKISPEFYKKLNEEYPTLTPNERKLCVFLKLNMSNKDISKITFQSDEALKKARLRLRKKLSIDREVNLATFMQDL